MRNKKAMENENKYKISKFQLISIFILFAVICFICFFAVKQAKYLNEVNLTYGIIEDATINNISELKRTLVDRPYRDLEINSEEGKEVIKTINGREFSSKVGDKIKIIRRSNYNKNTGKTEPLETSILNETGYGRLDFVYFKKDGNLRFKNGEEIIVNKILNTK